ncbi:MAG: hypothetical protein ACXAD7_23635 [Candidatus Kariarchaeaceae archaeon]|jgi:flagellar biogenesis protein FliO
MIVNSKMYILYALMFFMILVIGVSGHGDIPEETVEGDEKPLNSTQFFGLMFFITICVFSLILLIHKLQRNIDLVSISKLSIIASATLLVNASVVAYLYVEV